MGIGDWAADIEFKVENKSICVYVNGQKMNGVMEIGFDSKNGMPIIQLSMLGINAYMYRDDGTKVTLKEMIENSSDGNVNMNSIQGEM